MDALWEFWTWVAEESLLALSQEALTDPGQVDRASPLPRAPVGLQRGWGTRRLLKRVDLCPRQRHVSGAPATAPLARLQAALGALWTVIRGSQDAPGEGQGPVRGRGAQVAGAVQAPRRGPGVAAAGAPRLGRGPTPRPTASAPSGEGECFFFLA